MPILALRKAYHVLLVRVGTCTCDCYQALLEGSLSSRPREPEYKARCEHQYNRNVCMTRKEG